MSRTIFHQLSASRRPSRLKRLWRNTVPFVLTFAAIGGAVALSKFDIMPRSPKVITEAVRVPLHLEPNTAPSIGYKKDSTAFTASEKQ